MYVLISCFVVMLSFLILMNAGINMKFNKINMISFVFYIYFILMSYIGQILVLENIVFVDAFPLLIKNNYYECLYVWISTSYAMIMFSSTIYLINKLIFKRKLINNKLKKSIIVLDDHANSCLYLVLSLLSIVVIVNIVIRLKYVGVLNLFLGGYDSAIRSYFTYNFTYNQYVVNIIGFILSQILTYIWYIKWSIFKNKYYLFMFIIMLIFSLIILSMRLAKAPILIYLFSFVLLKVKINGEIKIHKFFIVILFLIYLLLCIYKSVYNFNYNEILVNIIHRIILGQNAGNYFCFICFPDVFSHLGVTSLSETISSILGISYSSRAARIIYDYAFGVSGSVKGTMVSLFIGDAWANFGLIGVILSPILVGIILGSLYYTSYFSNKIEMWALYAYFSIENYVVMDFASFIYPWSTFIQPLLLIYFLIFCGARMKKQVYLSNN